MRKRFLSCDAQRHCGSPSPAASFLWGKSVSLSSFSLLELLIWVFWGAAVGRAPSIPAGTGVSRSEVYRATCISSLCPHRQHRANPSQVKFLNKQMWSYLFLLLQKCCGLRQDFVFTVPICSPAVPGDALPSLAQPGH